MEEGVTKGIMICLIAVLILGAVGYVGYKAVGAYRQKVLLEGAQLGYNSVINSILTSLQENGFVRLNMANNQSIVLVPATPNTP